MNYAYPAGPNPPASNPLTSITPAGGTTRSFTYDAAGYILTDTRAGGLGMTFQYDTEGRLSRAFQTNAPTQGGTYAYDAMNRLASRTVTSGSTTTTTLLIHDLADHIIAETDTAGVTRREYIWLNDTPIAVVDGVNTASPTLYYVHTDHLGRPIEAMSQSGATVWEALYRPFGETVSVFNAVGFGGIDLRFPGQWFQLESGLAYNWHRHYDASLGRYVQPDPIGLAGGRSLFGYAGQNPLAYVDADGLAGMFVTFNGYSVDTGLGFSVPLGHSGVIAIDNDTGTSLYWDFGRYGGKYGDVRGPFELSPVKFDKSGCGCKLIPTAPWSDSLGIPPRRIF